MRRADQPVGVSQVDGDGLFDEDVLARLHGVDGDSGVQAASSADAHGVDVRPVREGSIVGIGRAAVLGGELLNARQLDIGVRRGFGRVELGDGLGVAAGLRDRSR